jgi:integrase
MSYENQHKLHDGRIVLYTRNGKPFFHARIKVDGVPGYRVASTKRRTLGEAARIAEEWYEERRDKARKGLELKSYTFTSLWKKWRASNEPLLSSHRLRYLDGTATRYFLPFFADRSVDAINDQIIEEYWTWRIKFWSSEEGEAKRKQAVQSRLSRLRRYRQKLGNVAHIPAQKTLDMEKSALRQIFNWSHRVGITNRIPHIRPPKLRKGYEVVRRPAFDEQEWAKLAASLHGWLGVFPPESRETVALERGHELHRWQRTVFSAYVFFLYHSGLRPNEARQLRWRDITEIKTQTGACQLLLHVSPVTKTGTRDVVPEKMARLVLQKLRKISYHTEPDDPLFCDRAGHPIENFGKTFKKVLNQLDLLNDSYGRTRTIYSLRHTYATFALLRGVNAEDLAQNMGTSPMQIHRHYRHVKIQQRADQMGGAAPTGLGLNKNSTRTKSEADQNLGRDLW